MTNRPIKQPHHAGTEPTFDRRRLMKLLAGGAALVASACSHGSAEVVSQTSPTAAPLPTFDDRVPPPIQTPSRSTATAAPSSTPSGSATPSPLPGPQILYRGGFTAEPASHDFNANLFCSGDPSLWSGLLALNTDLTPMGDWADHWEANADSSAWTFHLRHNNSGWSNAKSVTAYDFVWSWQRMIDPATNAPQAWLLYDVVNAIDIHDGKRQPSELGVQATDDWTVVVNLVGPRVYFPTIAATIGLVPAYRQAVESFGDSWTDADHCVSNGPFRLTSWNHGDHWTTEPNPNHWNSNNVRLEQTVVPIIPDTKHQQPYFNAAVDFMPVNAGDVTNVRSISDYASQMISSIDPAVWFLIVSPTNPPFDDQRVRKAVARAIDRKRLEQLSEGRASAAQSLLPTTFPLWVADGSVEALQQFDVDQALQGLAGTEYAGGENWPSVELLISESDEVPQLLATDCAEQLLENLGMKIDVKTVSEADYASALSAGTSALFWRRWDYTYPDPNNGYSDAFFPIGSETPLLPLTPADLGDLVGRAKVEQSDDARELLYRDCETTLQTAVAYIPIAYPVTFYLIRPWIAGFPLVGDSSVLQPGLLFTRLTSLVSIKDREAG
ncbi:MAG: peptide ABC transporter substrate-binding protein [Nitrolancea sp.]